MKPTDFANALLAAAEQHAKALGFRFGDGAQNDIRRFSVDATARVSKRYGVLDDAGLREATDSFERLIDEMIKASKEIPGYQKTHAGMIGEETLKKAMAKLCPLWPICDKPQ